MYLKHFKIAGIKCFEDLDIPFPHQAEDYSGWTVVLGGNGVGKSTLLQAMALTLLGPLAGQRLVRPEGWVRDGIEYGTIEAEIVKGPQDSQLGQPRRKPYEVAFAVIGTQEVEIDHLPYDQPQIVHRAEPKDRKALFSGPYGAKRSGWFSCGYGPFRRLSGGDTQPRSLPEREVRFATLFSESAALTQCEDWLMSLYSRSLDEFNQDKERDKTHLEMIKGVINYLLPGTVAIERIDSKHVHFRSVGRVVVAMPELSDGYRSFLALVIDMLRHITESGQDLSELIQTLPDGSHQILIEGIVLVDEIDSHLHPVWQRDIGFRMRQIFPRVQFIVTTHSPFVAQAATDNGLFVLKPKVAGGLMEALRPVESVRGWRVDQILMSDLFGLTETRDEETEKLLRRHGELVARRTWTELSQSEREELTRLEEALSERLTAPGETVQERERQAEMAAYVDRTLKELEAHQ
jgi:AAA domain, putative AbiEii toxin, Type IV TA system/AAA domain